MDLALRPMSTSQILDRTFQLYRRNFILFAGIAALPPALLMAGQAFFVLGAFMFARMPAPLLGTGTAEAALVASIVLYVALYFAGYCLATGANIFAVSRTHLGKQTTIGESYREIRPYAWTLVKIVVLAFLAVTGVMAVGMSMFGLSMLAQFGRGIGIVATLIAAIVFIVCAVLAIRLSLSFTVAPAVCVVEKSGAIASLKRSRFLAKGAFGQIILVNLLAGLIVGALSLVFNLPAFIASATAAAAGKENLGLQIWQMVAGFFAGALGGPIATISIALIYFDRRIRKEAFDLQLMMEAVGMAQPAQAQAAHAGGSGPAPTIG